MNVRAQSVFLEKKNLSLTSTLWIAAAFGLAAGLSEGVGLLIFRGYGWGNTRIPEGVSASIVWVSASVNLGLFALLGLVSWALLRALRRPWISRATLYVFAFLLFVDLLGVNGRIGPLGMIVFAAGLASVAGKLLHERMAAIRRWAPKIALSLAAITFVAFLGIEGYARSREQTSINQLPLTEPGAPNVIVVVVDTLRADHLSFYGYSRPTSPFLERMAGEGTQFEQAISPSSWTLPAHQALLSGRYPHEHGEVREQMVNPKLPSLGQIMASKGYRTAAFSANTDFFCRRAGFADGFQHFEDYFYSTGDMVYRTFWGRLFYRTYVAELLGLDELPARKKAADVNAEMFRWIGQNSQHPFFAFLNYFDIHYPYVPEQSYRNKFTDARQQESCRPSWAFRLNPLNRPTEFERLMAMSPACFQVQVDQYDGGVSYVDQQIGNLMAELERDGISRNTLVIVTSDHGESFREHGLVTHGTSLYRELIHVPLVIWWPGHVPAGQKIDRPVSTASLPATILDLLGSHALTDFPIPSLASLWRQPSSASSWPDPVSEMAQDIFIPPHYPAYRGWLKSITDSQWHLIVAERDPAELYDWPDDLPETRNVVESVAGKTAAAEINAKLWNQVGQANHTKANFNPPTKSNQLANAGQ